MTLSTGQVGLLRTLWALGTGCMIGGSLAMILASFLIQIPSWLLWHLLVASGASFLIHVWLNKMEKS